MRCPGSDSAPTRQPMKVDNNALPACRPPAQRSRPGSSRWLPCADSHRWLMRSRCRSGPVRPPMPSPSVQATDEPQLPFASGGTAWNAFMDMVNNYAEAKKRLSFEPTSDKMPPPISSPPPTTEFHAAWTQSLARWHLKSSDQKPSPAPTTEMHGLLRYKIEKWKSRNIHKDENDGASDSP